MGCSLCGLDHTSSACPAPSTIGTGVTVECTPSEADTQARLVRIEGLLEELLRRTVTQRYTAP